MQLQIDVSFSCCVLMLLNLLLSNDDDWSQQVVHFKTPSRLCSWCVAPKIGACHIWQIFLKAWPAILFLTRWSRVQRCTRCGVFSSETPCHRKSRFISFYMLTASVRFFTPCNLGFFWLTVHAPLDFERPQAKDLLISEEIRSILGWNKEWLL